MTAGMGCADTLALKLLDRDEHVCGKSIASYGIGRLSWLG
jgi:hypothetical protein